MKKHLSTLLLMLLPGLLFAQAFQFRPGSGVTVLDGQAKSLAYPFAGGMVAPQFQQVDLNNDGIKDLVAFDRGDNRIMCWLRVTENGQQSWQFSPDYAAIFPPLLYWVHLVDFNGDGREDLITASPSGGARVYVNQNNGFNISWQLYLNDLIADFGFGPGFNVPFFALSIDYPAVADLDGDGDIDLLSFDIFYSGQINYYRNMAKERYNRVDTFDLLVTSRCYGLFFEDQSSSDIIQINDDCSYTPPPSPSGNPTNAPYGQRTRPQARPSHAGSTIWPLFLGSDTLADLLLGDIENPRLTLLRNHGTRDTARMTQIVDSFPLYTEAAFISAFPAAYGVDVMGSARKDLIVTTNDPYVTSLGEHSWLYENVAGSGRDSFRLVNKRFLIDDMLQFGRYAAPVFIDVDNDGDRDLLISYLNNAQKAVVHKYLRQGNSFSLADTNYLLLPGNLTGRIRMAAADLNGDGLSDLLLGTSGGDLMYYQNSGNGFSLVDSQYQQIQVGQHSSPAFGDINGDGKIDLLVANQQGRIVYFENNGTTAAPVFVKQSDSLGFIDLRDGFFTGNAHLAIGDFNGNGDPDLVAGNEWGKLFLFADIRQKINQRIVPSQQNFFFPETAILTDISPTTFGAPAIEDVDGDNLPDLFIGTFRGGIEFYKNSTNQLSVIDREQLEKQLQLYPNPTSDFIQLVLNTHENSLEKVSLRDIQGRLLFETPINQLQSYQLDLGSYSPGLYLVEVQFNRGGSLVKKVIKGD